MFRISNTAPSFKPLSSTINCHCSLSLCLTWAIHNINTSCQSLITIFLLTLNWGLIILNTNKPPAAVFWKACIQEHKATIHIALTFLQYCHGVAQSQYKLDLMSIDMTNVACWRTAPSSGRRYSQMYFSKYSGYLLDCGDNVKMVNRLYLFCTFLVLATTQSA